MKAGAARPPAVSVIVPLYNKGPTVARALRSILSQGFRDFEVLVVDDGSTDEGPAVARGFSDERLLILSQRNSGPGAARNLGIRRSRAPLVGFLDADDEWLDGFLERSVARLERHPDCAATVAGHLLGDERRKSEIHFRAAGIPQGAWRPPPRSDARLLKTAVDFLLSGAVVCRREAAEGCGGFYSKDRCLYGEDAYLWIQLLLNHKVYLDHAPLVWVHTEAAGLSTESGRPPPPSAVVLDPEPIRRNCPPAYRDLLESYLALSALQACAQLIDRSDYAGARRILERFPLVRAFPTELASLRFKISWPAYAALRRWARRLRRALAGRVCAPGRTLQDEGGDGR